MSPLQLLQPGSVSPRGAASRETMCETGKGRKVLERMEMQLLSACIK